MKLAPDAEPPSRPVSPIFMIGQDSRGHWVVCDQTGDRGGLFVNRAEALRYIRSENENHPYPTVTVAGVLELDLAGRKKAALSREAGRAAPDQRTIVYKVA
jgi:hypothetical protein